MSNYRPISILLVFSMGLKKIIYQRLALFCDKNSIIGLSQYGFRIGRSKKLALLAQKEFILESFEHRYVTLGIFLKFSKAFDQINHDILLCKLDNYSIDGVPLNLIRSYLSFRKQSTLVNSRGVRI